MIVVVGGSGQLGSAFRTILPPQSTFLSSAALDLTDVEAIPRVLDPLRPSLVLNCAGYNDVDGAESEPEEALAVNAYGPEALSKAAAQLNCRFVSYSTESVFDGRQADPYLEHDTPNPQSSYGRSKALGEELVIAANPAALVVRTSWLLSPRQPNFVSRLLDHDPSAQVAVVSDQRGHPTVADDLAAATLAALDRGASGLLHLTNQGTVSRHDLAVEVYELAGRDATRVRACSTAEYGTAAFRPANSTLGSSRLDELGLDPLPHYRPGLERAVAVLSSAG